jgi:hypothetical protein
MRFSLRASRRINPAPPVCRRPSTRAAKSPIAPVARPVGTRRPPVKPRDAPIDGEPLESNLDWLPRDRTYAVGLTTFTLARTALCGPDRDLVGATSLKSSPTASVGFGSGPLPGLRTRNTPDLTARFFVTPHGRRACRSGPGASRAIRAGEGPPYPRRARHSPPAGRRSPAPRSGRFRP